MTFADTTTAVVKIRRKRRRAHEYYEYTNAVDAASVGARLAKDPTVKLVVLLGRHPDGNFYLLRILK